MIRSSCIAVPLILHSAGCSPAPKSAAEGSAGATMPTAGQDGQTQPISVYKILRDVVGHVVMITEISDDSEPTEWTFDADEFKQAEILSSEATATTATITIFMTTRNNPKPDEDAVQVTGRLRLYYQRQSDKWVLKKIDNLSFRYTVGVST